MTNLHTHSSEKAAKMFRQGKVFLVYVKLTRGKKRLFCILDAGKKTDTWKEAKEKKQLSIEKLLLLPLLKFAMNYIKSMENQLILKCD